MIPSNKKRPRTIYKKVGGGLMWFENRHITLGTSFMAYPENIEAQYKTSLIVVGTENINAVETAGSGFRLVSASKRENKIVSGKVGIKRPNGKQTKSVVIVPFKITEKRDIKQKVERTPPRQKEQTRRDVISRETPINSISRISVQRPIPKQKERIIVREKIQRVPLLLENRPYLPIETHKLPIKIEKENIFDLFRPPAIGWTNLKKGKVRPTPISIDEQQEIKVYKNKRYPKALSLKDMELSGISKQLNRNDAELLRRSGKEVGIGIMDKHDILSEIHRLYNPEIYFEIGVDLGVSIRLATRTAIGVDPNPLIGGNVNAAEIHKITSDSFFEQNLLKGRKPDLVFIDGWHSFEQVIRDFRNVEKSLKETSIVVIDDILPTHPLQTSREWRVGPNGTVGMWTGDVWKFVPILKKYRPDLKITMLDSWPTGLICITNFDSNNTVLWSKYDQIVKEWMNTPVPDYIYKRENVDLRQDIDFAIRNIQKVSNVRILCYFNHFYNPSPKGDDFLGGSTGGREERRKTVQKCLDTIRALKGCEVKVCGIPGFNLVPIDIDLTGKDPKHIPYESLNLMRASVDKYDYFLNIEDDILIGSDVINNIIEFDKTSGGKEILIPNRIEQRGDFWDCVDLRAMASWSKNKKRWNGLLLREAVNCHSGMLCMSTKKFKEGVKSLDPTYRKQFHGGPMASAFAYFHSPFTLYRNSNPNKFHSVWHLDNWIHIQERINHTKPKIMARNIVSYIETKIPYGLNGDISGAYNMAMAATNAEWVVLLDQDVFLCNPFWYQICLDAINTTPLNTGMITCMCNPLHGADKRTSEVAQQAEIEIRSTNIEEHIKVAEKLYAKYGSTVQAVTDYKLAGYFMLVKKEIWDAVRFKSIGTGVLGTDWNFAKMLLSLGYKIYRVPGLYVYHRRGLRSLNWKLK